jgi:hypothetical protein
VARTDRPQPRELQAQPGPGPGQAAVGSAGACLPRARVVHFRVLLRQSIGAVSLHAFAATTLLAIGGVLVVEGQLTIGQLVAAELIVSSVLASFAKFGKQLETFYDLLCGLRESSHGRIVFNGWTSPKAEV